MNNTVVGFSISENSLRVVQLAQNEGSFRIEKMAQEKFPHPFRLLTLDNQERFRAILSTLENLVKREEWPSTIGVSIPDGLVLIKEIPIDEDLSDEELDQQARWEAVQFLPNGLSEEYLLSYKRLNVEESSVLLVAFRELVLRRVRQAFEIAGRTPKFLGVDIFSSLSAVGRLYDAGEGLSALLEVGENAARLALLEGGEYLLSKKLPYSAVEDNNGSVFDSANALAEFLKKEARKLLLDRKVDAGEVPIARLFVYGEKASGELVAGLENGPAVEVSLVNPFVEMEVPDGAAPEGIEENPSVWTPAVGAALETLEI